MYKIVTEIVVASRVVANFNFSIARQERATQAAAILILNNSDLYNK